MDFLSHLAICHTVIIQKKLKKDGRQENETPDDDLHDNEGKDSYSAQSPDELALINAAKQFGIRFIDTVH